MRNLIIAISVTVLLFAAGCEKTPGTSGADVPQAVLSTFEGMYPGAEDVQWTSRHSYWVASFAEYSRTKSPAAASGRNSAWFDDSGKWYMTEFHSELSFLPEMVKAAFSLCEYASWKVDDIDVIHRDGVSVVYVIEVEGMLDGREAEADLYFSEDGVLVKERFDVDDDYDYWDYIPGRPVSSVSDAVNSIYPGARIIDIEEDDGMMEVEIVGEDKIFREIYFSLGLEWLMTKTEMRLRDLPENVRLALARYREVDDIHFIETPSSDYYLAEVEVYDDDITVRISPEGEVTEI